MTQDSQRRNLERSSEWERRSSGLATESLIQRYRCVLSVTGRALALLAAGLRCTASNCTCLLGRRSGRRRETLCHSLEPFA